MSTTKLTLTIQDADLIAEAKAYAKASGRSLSNLVENYLKSLAISSKFESSIEETKSPLVDSIIGIGGSAPSKTDKDLLLEILEEKHS